VSLIYSALSQLDKTPANAGSGGPASNPYVESVKADRRLPIWIYVALTASALMVLGGWLVTVLLQSSLAPNASVKLSSVLAPTGDHVAMALVPPVPPKPLVVVTPLVAAPLTTGFSGAVSTAEGPMAAPVPVSPSPATSPIAPKAAATPVQSKANFAPTAKPAEAVPVVKVAQAVQSAQARPVAIAPATTTAPALEEFREPAVIDPEVTRQLTVAVTRAIEAGKNDEAQALLQQLSQRLPAESITLLRLSAWQKMQAGDSAQAMALYRRISNRLPGDESAGINLALLHWRAGQLQEARQVMGDLSERHPESATVQRYQRELGAPR
jgi:thioredoxin-like negative regulator of GroEL